MRGADAGGWTYILASGRNGTLYTGSSRSLLQRVRQHREGDVPGFTRKYAVTRLVWYEAHEDIGSAYTREQRIKRWHRAWKLELIEKFNPQWRDLYEDLTSNLPSVTFLAATFPGRIPGESGGAIRDPGEDV